MDGWIKMHRKFLKWEWYKDIPCKVLALHYLLSANYEEKTWRGRPLKKRTTNYRIIFFIRRNRSFNTAN